jgi:murein DD-endopeptidase MepM/ murein hydrolase activator NlpD
MTDIQRTALSGFASNSGAADLDAFHAAEADLRERRQSLETLKAKNESALTSLSETQTSLDSKLADLQTLEVKLKDAEVKRAYDTKLAVLRVKQQAEAAAAQAALVAKATPPPVRGGAAAEPTTSAPVPVIPAAPREQDPPTPQPDAPDATQAPTTTTPPAAPKPVPTPAAQPSIGGLICPVAGPNAFGDSWGDPRPGGRHHEGVDMMSPQGTPLVAVVGGTATMKTNALGGITVGLKGNDGNYYYYAHLVAWAGSSRAVNQGDVVGYVGHTGDTAANHLHFGIYAGGGPAINPYPIVRRVC